MLFLRVYADASDGVCRIDDRRCQLHGDVADNRID